MAWYVYNYRPKAGQSALVGWRSTLGAAQRLKATCKKHEVYLTETQADRPNCAQTFQVEHEPDYGECSGAYTSENVRCQRAIGHKGLHISQVSSGIIQWKKVDNAI